MENQQEKLVILMAPEIWRKQEKLSFYLDEDTHHAFSTCFEINTLNVWTSYDISLHGFKC